jgi:hypothetical protein
MTFGIFADDNEIDITFLNVVGKSNVEDDGGVLK